MATEVYFFSNGISNAIRLVLGDVSVVPGLARHRLLIRVDLSPTSSAAHQSTLRIIAGEISVQGITGGGYLGTIGLSDVATLNPDGHHLLDLFVDISNEQVREIEQRRTQANGSFYLQGTVKAQITTQAGKVEPSWTGFQQHPVSREAWLQILSQVGYRRRMIVELDVPDDATNPATSAAIAYFGEAQAHFELGQYRQTAESIRQALAAAVGKSGDEEKTEDEITAEASEVMKATRVRSVGYDERMERARSALKFLADLGAHPEVAETDRNAALAQLHMAAGWLQWAAQGAS